MKLRPYQSAAIGSTLNKWQAGANSLLGVAATGLGKTVIFSSLCNHFTGRVMVLAHREELIFQAAEKIKAITNKSVAIEMAEMRSDEESALVDARADIVVSTIQTQGAGRNGGRMQRFNPDDFDLLIIDEAHHATAASYRKIIEYYRQNTSLKIFGVTATPDRTDKMALGQVFDDVAFDYDIKYGINDGWLVPIKQKVVYVDGLDLSAIRTTAGDLNGKDLADILEKEKAIHEIAAPTIEIVKDRKTLVFAASLAHAELLAEVLNRHKKNCAYWISGATEKIERRDLFKAYARGDFQYLVNVGVATEGFDAPSIEVVVMARPTKSRSLYTQMIGRGTRPLAGVVDGDAMQGFDLFRRQAIAESKKPYVEIIDFVGNCGKHKLISTVDILGGEYSDEIVERAKTITQNGDEPTDPQEALARASEDIAAEKLAAKKIEEAEIERRKNIIAKAKYQTETIDPFDASDQRATQFQGWTKERQPSEKMLNLLARQGIDTSGLTYADAGKMIGEMAERQGWSSRKRSTTPKQKAPPQNIPPLPDAAMTTRY